MATPPDIAAVRAALKSVKDAPSGADLIALGAIEGLSVTRDGVVRFTLNAERIASNPATLLDEARVAVERLAGVARVAALSTAHRAAAPTPGHDNPFGLKKERIATTASALSGVRCVIAVASGKGGVGKSTVAANLAVALAQEGLAVGLMDADIYGPSLPVLFGLKDRATVDDGKILPALKYGVKSMSIGLLVDAEKSLAWRGPMVMGAVRQLMTDVDWGTLDILVIDTPPGTGDAHLTLVQSKKLDGAVIVSTPQEMALADVRRGVELFRKTDTPILGVIENMAYLESAGGERSHIFGEGGAERAATALEAPFLGAIPLWPELRAASDAGVPLVISDPSGRAARAFAELARKLRAALKD